MKQIISKLQLKYRIILPTSFLLVSLTLTICIFLRWLLFFKLSNNDYSNITIYFWIPLFTSGIIVFVWFIPRIKIFNYKYQSSRDFLIATTFLSLFGMISLSQYCIETILGNMIELENIEEITNQNLEKYYKIKNYDVASFYGGSYTHYTFEGENNDMVVVNSFFVAPITIEKNTHFKTSPEYWIGIKFSESFKNVINFEEREARCKSIYRSFVEKMDQFDYKSFNHFVRTPVSDDKLHYLYAIENRIRRQADEKIIILEPAYNKYEDRYFGILLPFFLFLFVFFYFFISIILYVKQSTINREKYVYFLDHRYNLYYLLF
ncbi:MAG: hypothetical protein V4643_10380 [Bacteroidota bacterium]